MFRRILYASLVDVSLPNGPGVNERGFLKDMLARFGEELLAVIPTPSREMPKELLGMKAKFIPCRGSLRSVSGWSQANVLGSAILPRVPDRFRPDLIVMRAGALPIPQFLTARTAVAPYVLKTAGDIAFHRFYGKSAIRRSVKRINNALVSRLMHRALCIDVVNSTQRNAAIHAYPSLESRVHIVDNGVDLDHFSPSKGSAGRRRLGFSDADVVIGYVGNLPMQRGGREVIDAVANLKLHLPAKGLVIGDSGEAEACRSYANDCGVSDNVTVCGEVDYEFVPELMASIDVGLSILRPAERHHSELKVRQYLAAGLTVVGTEGSNDFLRGQEFARVVASVDSRDVTDAISSLVANGRPGLVELSKSARDLAESTLSTRARNDQRLALWEDLSANSAQRGHSAPGDS